MVQGSAIKAAWPRPSRHHIHLDANGHALHKSQYSALGFKSTHLPDTLTPLPPPHPPPAPGPQRTVAVDVVDREHEIQLGVPCGARAEGRKQLGKVLWWIVFDRV